MFSNNKSIEKARIDAAKEILIKVGYRIIDPLIVNKDITNAKQLRDYFYMKLDSKYPHRLRVRLPNIKFDMQLISRFIESQMDGTNKFTAIQQCVDIINMLFDNESDFNFKYPITDIGILGQGKLSWITSKAVELLNKRRCELLENEIYKKADLLENECEVNADDVSNNLDNLLLKMGDNNG